MNAITKIIDWYKTYVKGSLTPEQPTFWLLFWGSVVAGCATYYTCTFYFSDYLRNLLIPDSGLVITYICVLLPFVVLRRLHVVGLMLIGYFIVNWSGFVSVAFWLFLLLYGVHRRRTLPEPD